MDQPIMSNQSGSALDQGLLVETPSLPKRLSKRRWVAIGVIVVAVLVALGVGADLMWGQQSKPSSTTAQSATATPTISASAGTSPTPQTSMSTNTSDAQLDQDLQQANQSMSSLDQENQSADAGLNDQAPNLTY